MKQNITKQLCVFLAVHKLLTGLLALELEDDSKTRAFNTISI